MTNYNQTKNNFRKKPTRTFHASFSKNFRGGGGGGNRSRYGGGGGGRGRGRFSNAGRGQRIDISRFIHKAEGGPEPKPYVPKYEFADFDVEAQLKQNLIDKGYKTPTPIQDQAIPYALTGVDLIGIANTGTGKTAAFLIPLIHKVRKDPKQNILIMVPTRELAIQIETELRSFTKGMRIFSVCCVGGAPIGRQIRALGQHNNFIIGTPGRLKDLVERKRIDLPSIQTVVLDEADRMLDMGFIADMRFIMSKMAEKRHTLFFSATFSRDIEKLTKEFLNDPVKISVKTGDTAKNVDQDIVRVKRDDKINTLHDLLKQKEFSKVLIFGKTKHGVEKLSNTLADRGIKVDSIHGDKNHTRRQQALRQFKGNEVNALVATDVAARGLDISDVSHVINFDIPATYEDYVHRIGRTGRGDKKGKALTFVE
jgi:ATP-dependent RNA helicase RhlE